MKVFLATADASGDLHASALVEALRARVGPTLSVRGLGGERLIAAGLEPIVEQSELAVAGLVEVLSSAPGILRAYAALRRELTSGRPDLAILVDSPDLNLPLASVAKRSGIPVYYYIAPQVWAWRAGRVRKLRRRVDRLGVIFPFEVPIFEAARVPATFVGHPLVDRMAEVRAGLRREEVAARNGLDLARPILSLLPGSRRNEVSANLGLMLETAELVRGHVPGVQVQLLVAPTLRELPERPPEHVRVVRGDTHAALAISTAALCAPGTVTVEAALLGVPLVVSHRVHGLTFELARRLARVPSSVMVNLIAGSGVVPERIQSLARPTALAALLSPLLSDPAARLEVQKQLADAAARLGEPGSAARAAELALEVAARSQG